MMMMLLLLLLKKTLNHNLLFTNYNRLTTDLQQIYNILATIVELRRHSYFKYRRSERWIVMSCDFALHCVWDTNISPKTLSWLSESHCVPFRGSKKVQSGFKSRSEPREVKVHDCLMSNQQHNYKSSWIAATQWLVSLTLSFSQRIEGVHKIDLLSASFPGRNNQGGDPVGLYKYDLKQPGLDCSPVQV